MSDRQAFIPIAVVRYQPLILGWIQICPDLANAIELGHIVGIKLRNNFYELNVTDDLDPVVELLLRYIGIVLIKEDVNPGL